MIETTQNITELGPVGFLRTILWVVAFYYIGKFLFRWWIKKKLNDHARKMNDSVDPNQADNIRKEQGHVRIKPNKADSNGNKNGGDSGEYVDYEEVK